MAKFEKGNPGRVAGTQNKLTRTVKETVLAVFNELQDDPVVKLAAWAKSEPTEFYKIAAKLIPTDIKADVNTIHTITLKIARSKGNNNQPSGASPGATTDMGEQESL